MKSKLLIKASIITFAISSSLSYSATSLRSTYLKKLLCDNIFRSVKKSSLKKCMAGKHTVTKEIKLKNDKGQKVTSVLHIESAFSQTTINSILKKLVSLGDEGQLKLGKWSFDRESNKKTLLSKTLRDANTSDNYVEQVKNTSLLPAKVKNWEAEYDSHATMADLDDDYTVGEYSYYKVLNPKNKKQVIGYIVEFMLASKKADLKILFETTLDTKGNVVVDTESTDGFGFYE